MDPHSPASGLCSVGIKSGLPVCKASTLPTQPHPKATVRLLVPNQELKMFKSTVAHIPHL